MIRYKYVSITLFSSLSTGFFACTIRIYERPYYQAVGALDFSTIGSSLWAVFINMSTVGYGATYPSTGPGRFLMIFATLVGAFLLSLLVSLIAVGLMLEENKKEALSEIAEKKRAGSVISTALKYNALRNLRYKMNDGHSSRHAPRSLSQCRRGQTSARQNDGVCAGFQRGKENEQGHG